MKAFALILFLGLTSFVSAQGDLSGVNVRITKASGNVYFLDCTGGFGGGNVAASIGDDGILLVDDMYAAMVPKLLATLKTISDKPVKIVLNTHFHGDHIQGNEVLHTSAVIIGHENVVKRLIAANKETAPTLEYVPAVTFSDRISVNFNGEEIRMIHFANSHTDSDSLVY